MKVKVYVYLGKIRCYIFLVNSRYISEVRRRGKKRINIIQLFKRGRPKLRKINPDDKFSMPDKEYEFSVPEFKLREC